MTRPVAITAQEQVQIDTAQSKFGGASALFDGGTNDYLLVDHTAQDIAYSDDFTFELWVRWASLPTAFSMLAQHSARGDYFSLYNKSGTYTMHAAVSNGSSVYYPIYNTPVTPTTNTWYHLAFVKSGSSFKMFWDGTECTTNNGSVNSMSADKGGNGIRRIGDYAGGSSYAMNGHIDEVRYSKIARYTTNFTPPTTAQVNDADTLFLMHMDGTDASTTFLDDNGSGRSAVGIAAVGNAQVDASIVKIGNGSAVFDASGDYLNTDAPLIPATGDFTIEYWYNQQTLSANRAHFQQYAAAVYGRMGMYTIQTTGQLRFYILGTDSVDISSSSNIAADTWYHIAVVRNSGTTTMYLDGVSVGSSTGTENIYQGANFQIGVTGGASSAFGNIDEFRVSSSARYTSGFAAPTTAHVNDADTLLLIHADGTAGSTTFLDDNSYFEAAPAGVTHEGAAGLTVSTTVTATAGVIKGTSVNLSGVFSPTILAVASRNGSIDMAVQVDFASTANRFLSTDVTLANLVNLSLQAARVRPAESDLNVSFDAITAASRTRQTSSSLAVSFEQTTTATRIKQFDATLAGVFSPAIVAIASRNGSIDAAAQTSLTVTPLRIQQLDSALSVNANLNSAGGYLLEDSASLTVSTGLVANAIEYIGKTEWPNNRPKTLTIPPDKWTIDNSVYKHGLGSIKNIYSGGSSNIRIENILGPEASSATTESYTLEFWYKTDNLISSTSSVSLFSITSVYGDNYQLFIDRTYQISGVWYIDFDLFGPGTVIGLTAVPWTPNTWHHISMQTRPRVIGVHNFKLTVDNVYSNTSGVSLVNPDRAARLIFSPYYLSGIGNTTRYDSISLRIGNNAGEFIPAQGWSAEPTNSETDTHALFLFNENFLDGPLFMTLYGDANLASAFSATATLGGTFGASANPAAAATLTAQADKVVEATATLATAFTATTAASRLLTTDVSLNTTFSETSTAGRIRRAATSLNSAFTQNVTASRTVGATTSQDTTVDLNAISLRIKQIDSSLSAFVSTITAAGKVGDFFVDVDLTATLATTAQRTAGLTADLTTATTLTAEALRIQPGAADLDTTADFTVDGQLVSGAIANLDTTVSLSAAGIRAEGLIANLNNEFSATAIGVTFKGTTTALVASVVTLECAVEVTRNASANLDVTSAQTASGIKAIEASATLNGVFSPNVIAVATRVGEIELTVTVDATTTAVKTASSTATAPATATLASSVSAIRATTVELACSADLTAAGGGLSNGVVDLTVAATLSAQGSIINTQRYVYVVPRESRVVSIAKETRTHTVHKETRIYTLGEL